MTISTIDRRRAVCPERRSRTPQVQKYKQHRNTHTQVAAAKSRARLSRIRLSCESIFLYAFAVTKKQRHEPTITFFPYLVSR